MRVSASNSTDKALVGLTLTLPAGRVTGRLGPVLRCLVERVVVEILKAILKLFIDQTCRMLFLRSIQLLVTHMTDSLAHLDSWKCIHVLLIVIPGRVWAKIVSSHVLSMMLVRNQRHLVIAGLKVLVVVLHFILRHLLLVLLIEHKVPTRKPLVPKGLLDPTIEFVD